MKRFIKLFFVLVVFFNVDTSKAQSPTSQISDEQAHEIVFKNTSDDVRNFVQNGHIVNKVKYSE